LSWFGVVNPAAGRRGSPYSEVLAVSSEIGLDAEFVESTSPSDVILRISDAHAAGHRRFISVGGDGHRRFISVGGDGTAHLVLNAIMQATGDERCVLGIVPAGSGSDFVRTFGHRRGVRPGLERIVDADLYTVDIGTASGSFGNTYFLNALNLGVAAASAATANRLPRRAGSARYTTAFWIALWRFASGPIIATVDRHRFEGPHRREDGCADLPWPPATGICHHASGPQGNASHPQRRATVFRLFDSGGSPR